mmetsp:Transcript_7223/g.22777  ORF Transcript_7223/g.22777 Transcript_7223/m.22777 type:complete len:357 (+) Transcript_7223:386-1456(+)
MAPSKMAYVAASAVGATSAVALFWLRRRRRTVVRAALDIGSGEHKLVVAATRPGGYRKVLHSQVVTVLLAQDMRRAGGDGSLSAGALRASREALGDLKAAAEKLGATEYAGVATAVFRRATNGMTYLAKASAELGLNVKIVAQSLEGELGYLTAVGAAGPRAKAPLVSWDSGGGSFQLAARGAGGLRVYEGPLGNADVHRELEDKSALPPRVVAVDVASRLPDAPEWLADAITGGTVVAFGHRSSCFRVCADALGKRSYGPDDVADALEKVLAHPEKNLDGDAAAAAWLATQAQAHANVVAPGGDPCDGPYPEPHLAIAKLVLVLAVMTKLDIKRIEYRETNGSCLGVLLHAPLWA